MIGNAVVGSGAVCAVVAALWGDGGAARPYPGLVIACAVVVLVAAGLALAGRQHWAGPLGVVAALWAAVLLYVDLDSGVPGNSTTLLLVSALAVTAGALIGGTRVLGAVIAVALVAALAVSGAAWVPATAVSLTAGEPVVPAALAERPADQPWKWTGSGAVVAAVPAGAGVVIGARDESPGHDEIVGVDGPTGARRWSYARPDAALTALTATPDRALVVAAFAPGNDWRSHQSLLVTLDAMTGEPLSEWAGEAHPTTPTTTVLPIWQGIDDDHRVTGVDLRDGTRLWSWSAPAGCRPTADGPVSGADVLLVPLWCADTVTVLALDERTGEVRWEQSEPFAAGRFTTTTSPDGRVAAVTLPGRDPRLVWAESGEPVADLASGPRYPRVDLGVRPVAEERAAEEVLRAAVLDVETGEPTALDPRACPRPLDDATTATTYLRLCENADGVDLVWHTYGGPITRVPLPWSGRTQAVLLSVPGAVVAVRVGQPDVLGFPAA
ncbi:hypothetical protein Actkin_02807 [Actinokineospora sp. UTMC 2448]|nr:hypothetical protein Actkin_02807 [Actinokineospora sp. UTMC 2448]